LRSPKVQSEVKIDERKIGTLVHGWWECKMVQPLWKAVWQFLKKLNIQLSYNPAIPPPGIYLKESKRGIRTDSQKVETNQVSISR